VQGTHGNRDLPLTTLFDTESPAGEPAAHGDSPAAAASGSSEPDPGGGAVSPTPISSVPEAALIVPSVQVIAVASPSPVTVLDVGIPLQSSIGMGAAHAVPLPAAGPVAAAEPNAVAPMPGGPGGGNGASPVAATSPAVASLPAGPLRAAGTAAQPRAVHSSDMSSGSSGSLLSASISTSTSSPVAASSSSAEGGFVELDPVSPGSPRPAAGDGTRPVSGPSPIAQDARAAGDEAATVAGDGDGAEPAPIADTRLPPIDDAPGKEALAGGAGQNAMPDLAADEGGMIVLDAASSSPADISQTMLASSPEESPHEQGGGLRSDKPMARFQAFDVADGLASRWQSDGSTSQEPQHQGQQAAAVRHGATGKTAQATAAGGAARNRTILRSVVSLPLVIVAALLTGVGTSFRRRFWDSARHGGVKSSPRERDLGNGPF
jgi:hypothetical protein